MSKTLYKDEDFKLSFEDHEGELFIHVKIERATKVVLTRILQEFAKFKAWAYFEGYENFYTYTKDTRMFRIFGATEVGEFVLDGELYKVGKWDLN